MSAELEAPAEAPAPISAESPVGERRRERKPRARIRPQKLAAARGRAIEGLEWLGRAPGPRAPILYRVLCAVGRIVLFGVFGLRVEVSGRELLPKGGYLLVVAAHRGWADPFIVIHALPVEPRPWFLGSGPSTFTSPGREALIKRIGGLLPVWRGGVGVEAHVRSARAVVEAGGVFVQMPEGTVNGPAGTIGPFRPGAALIALRLGAPIVPMAMAGTEELYVGHRMAARILPPTTIAELTGEAWDGRLPAPGSREELDLARRATDALANRLRPAVEALQPRTIDPPSRPRRLGHWLTWLFLGPGPLEH